MGWHGRSAEGVINNLGKADLERGKGSTVARAFRLLGVTESREPDLKT